MLYKKITIISSSPRKNGVTNKLLKSFKEGLINSGTKVVEFNLYKNKIKFCDGCFMCWYENISKCKISDDFNRIYNELMSSDLVILASPIYGMNINGILKTFLDRLSMVSHLPDFKIDNESKLMTKPMNNNIPPIVIFLVGNMSGKEIFNSAKYFFNEYFRITNTEILAIIQRCQSELLTKPILEEKKREVFNFTYHAGVELIKNGYISAKVIEKIEQELLDTENFVKGHNLYWQIIKRKKLSPKTINFDKYPILKI